MCPSHTPSIVGSCRRVVKCGGEGVRGRGTDAIHARHPDVRGARVVLPGLRRLREDATGHEIAGSDVRGGPWTLSERARVLTKWVQRGVPACSSSRPVAVFLLISCR